MKDAMNDHMVGRSHATQIEMEIPCPFCGGKVSAGYTGEVPTVLHSLPPCDRFLQNESPIDFLHACNEKNAN